MKVRVGRGQVGEIGVEPGGCGCRYEARKNTSESVCVGKGSLESRLGLGGKPTTLAREQQKRQRAFSGERLGHCGLSPEPRMQRSGGRAQGLKLPTVPQDKLRFRFDVRVDHVSFQADGIDRPLAVALSRGCKVAQTAPVRMNG